jgi:hypothetical protein
VAAHIKKRSECSDVERRDARSIVMAACKFGCNELYEHDYITLAEDGKLMLSSEVESSEHVSAYARVQQFDRSQVLTFHDAPQAAEQSDLRPVGDHDITVQLLISRAGGLGSCLYQPFQRLSRYRAGHEAAHRPHGGKHLYDRRLRPYQRWVARRRGSCWALA